MPSPYNAFVSEQLKKAPAHLKQTEKMKWCGALWKSRKEGKGGKTGLPDQDPATKPKKPKPKPTDIVVKSKGKGEGLVAPGAKSRAGGRGLKGKGTAAKKKEDLFKQTTKVANIAHKTGLMKTIVDKMGPLDAVNQKIATGTTAATTRKGANLISMKVHR